ncbi:hypothetical protein MGA5115_03429 [Marinomonas gallaica]|uniref:DUF423 domain-containing protein n=1 Tax=Marinomonas gallaica TaxID=1806667 RepID=A0A1C3JVU8_9GAMM|nr:DUF423 domain-containing protein [Marinomonas gallaica]SBT19267.1 hypothetical protein MGA5115_03429 [Marinomonas gallaica]SBT20956.1 hypothetical protein MGA5116_01543 [Marinomonas gallaica]
MQLSRVQQRWGAIATLQAFISVAAGAFGAHGLKQIVAEQNLAWWQTASQYMMYHSLGGILAVVLMAVSARFLWSVKLFTLGNLLFSGSLFVMTLTDIRLLGAITPIGGVLYLSGWLVLLIGFLKPHKNVVN